MTRTQHESDAMQAYYDAKEARVVAVEQRAAGEDGVWRGELRLDCPRGHCIHWLTLSTDHNWHPLVEPSPERRMPWRNGAPVLAAGDQFNSSDLDEARADHVRWRVRCPKCAFSDTPLVSTLLALALVARRLEARSFQLGRARAV